MGNTFIEFKTKSPHELVNEIQSYAGENNVLGYSQYEIKTYDDCYGLELNGDFVERMIEAGFSKFRYLTRI